MEQIVEILRSGGYDARPQTTSGPGDATALARRAAAGSCAAVFAFGGDGTLRETAAGLLGSTVPLGFIPAGTANVMALVFGLPRSPLRAAAAVARARPREIDVGLCGDEPFLMQASAGLDAFVIGTLRSGFKRRLGRTAVGITALAASLRYGYPEIELAVDGRHLTAGFAAVSNVPYYGGRWRLVPTASADDRRLDLLVFHGRGWAATMAFARDLFLGGRHLQRRDVEVLPVRERVEILAPDDLPLQIDGDVYPGAPPLRIEMSPLRLRVLAA